MSFKVFGPGFVPAEIEELIGTLLEDVSYGNDVSPSFVFGDRIVFVDHEEPSKRELPCSRFWVMKYDLETEPDDSVLFATDDVAEMVAFIRGYHAGSGNAGQAV